MAKNEREPGDFMTIDSLSSLPFMKPTQSREKIIKLFGIELRDSVEEEDEDELVSLNTTMTVENPKETSNVTGRRFECHYCCRNFPTSQALGGHQNAHKRERQQERRAHFQNALAHAANKTQGPFYGICNYNLNGTPVINSTPLLQSSTNYPIWDHRKQDCYNSGLLSQQMNSRLFPGLNYCHSSLPLSLFAGEDAKKPRLGGADSSQRQSVYESCDEEKDRLRLDLHL